MAQAKPLQLVPWAAGNATLPAPHVRIGDRSEDLVLHLLYRMYYVFFNLVIKFIFL